MKNNNIAILILNWNGLNDTIECIRSIFKNDYRYFHIFCLDNGSENDDYIRLKKIKSKLLTVFHIRKNLGFAGGNNYLATKIDAGKYDFLFLLNNDTVLDKSFLKEMNIAINSIADKKMACLFPTIYYYDSYLSRKKIWRADDSNYVSDVYKVISHPTGCAFLISCEVYVKNGLFKSEFFAYAEELELFYRLKNSGYRLYYSPKAVMWHKVIEAEDSEFKIYMISRNKWYYFKYMSLLDKLPYLLYILFFYNIKKTLIYSKKISNLKLFFKGNIDGLSWIITGKKPINPFIKNE